MNTGTMNTQAVDDKLWTMMSEKLGLDRSDIHLDASFSNDLGVDSLDALELFTEVEKEFGIKIEDEEAEKLTTVKALVKYVHAHLQ
jgi:acyl carrier protein